MKKGVFWSLLGLFGIGVGALLAAGYSLCKSENHPIPDSFAEFTRIEIPGEHNRTTVAWIAPGTNGKGLILAHGNSSDRRSVIPRMRHFHSLGYTVIAPDLNAHGETIGSRKTFGYLESKDIGRASQYLRKSMGIEWVAALGTSLGGAAVLRAEADGCDFDAIIIESVFRDIRTAAGNRLEMRLGPLGRHLEPLLTAQIPLWMGVSREAISPMAWARSCHAPILVLSGDADERARPWESEAIYSSVPSSSKRIRLFKGAKHQDLFAFDRLEYDRETRRFLDSSGPERVGE